MHFASSISYARHRFMKPCPPRAWQSILWLCWRKNGAHPFPMRLEPTFRSVANVECCFHTPPVAFATSGKSDRFPPRGFRCFLPRWVRFHPGPRKLDHWPESITSQARSAQRCWMRSFSLHEAFVKQARDSTRQGALRKLVGASWSVQVALRKLLRASCSGKLVPASGSLQVALCKLRSLQVALCKLLCASCSVQVALRKLLCASCSRQGALRKLVGASWSAQVALCKLLCASCFKMQVASCDARPRTREESKAGARTTRQLPRTSSNNKSRKKPRVFAPQPRRFPQGVARAPQKSQKKTRVFAPRPRRFPQRVAREL